MIGHILASIAALIAAIWAALSVKKSNDAINTPATAPADPIQAPTAPAAAPAVTSEPKAPTSHLEDFVQAIARFEGFYTPGTVPKRCNNPGDLRWPFGEPYPYAGVTGVTPANFLEFKNKIYGFEALRTYVRNVCTGKSALYNKEAKARGRASCAYMTIFEFFDVYAPTSDNNPTSEYAAYVAKACGLTPQSPMSMVYS